LLTSNYLQIHKRTLANKINDWTRRQNSSVKPFSAFHAVAVAAEIVMPAVRANEPARGIGLQPPFVLAAVPDSVLRSQHPAMALTIEDCEIANREPERTGLQTAGAPLRDQRSISGLGLGEWVDRHRDSIARDATPNPARSWGPRGIVRFRGAKRWGVESIGTGPR
jgi:hypothetical protein